ncbi:MAG: DUF87 domain-containing protein [Dehalococcoidia bacterium]|nr:DUF87 domain-containing protein [Dehalococcoidia bacterium]
MSERRNLGVVVGGSLAKSVEVRLEPGASAQLGQYVMSPLEGGSRLLGMVTDVALKAAEAGPTSWPPPTGDTPFAALLRDVLLDTAVYTQVEVNPYLEVPTGGGEPTRARRLPRHFAPVALADQEALAAAFAADGQALTVGTPLGMDDVQVWVPLERLFERSVGVFGKSGTGKTVTTLLLLDALVQDARDRPSRGERTVALVFDMHDDYGWRMKFQGGERQGLKQRHPAHVCMHPLEDNVANSDGRLVVGTRDIEPADLEVLQTIGQFTAQAIEVAYECRDRFGQGWIDELLADDPSPAVVRKTWREGEPPEEVNWTRVASRLGFHSGSLDNLRRGLGKFRRKEFVQSGAGQFARVLEAIVQELLGGKSVVIQFGRFGTDMTSYMLVANMLSRRIWERYRAEMEAAQGDRAKEPNRLVIVIEEAHKFVDRSVAGKSIFGDIARELRKYNVTLLVIDQRPSQIDPEVLSQIGTKFCFQLDSEADVEALVGGIAGRAGLRQVIAALESRRQALVFGHALPMPVVVRPPELAAGGRAGATLRARLEGNGARAERATPAGLFGA